MTQLDFKFDIKKHGYEQPDTVSLTVPNQAMSIGEIYRRFCAGTLPPIAREQFFDPDPDFESAYSPDVDLTDREDAIIAEHEIRLNIAKARQADLASKKANKAKEGASATNDPYEPSNDPK